MNLNRVLRPALKILTTTLVTVVTVAGVTSGPSTSTAAPAKASSVKLASAQSVFPAYSDAYYEQGVQYWVNVQRKRHGLLVVGAGVGREHGLGSGQLDRRGLRGGRGRGRGAGGDSGDGHNGDERGGQDLQRRAQHTVEVHG